MAGDGDPNELEAHLTLLDVIDDHLRILRVAKLLPQRQEHLCGHRCPQPHADAVRTNP